MLSPIFVLGFQRSGTTLLVSMLGRSAEVQMLPSETHFYILLWKFCCRKKVSGAQLKSYCKAVLPRVNKGWTIPENQNFLSRIFEGIGDEEMLSDNPGVIMDRFFRAWTDNASIHTGEKTPAHIFYMKEIMKKFPNAKVIALVRDPRAAMLSEIVKLDNNKEAVVQFSLFNFIFRTQCVFDLIEKWNRKYPDNFKTYRYEDIISTPEHTLKDICSFLSIEYLPSMLEVGVKNSSFGDERQTGIFFNTQNAVRWKSQLNTNQIYKTEYLLGNSMQAYGYSLSAIKGDKPTLFQRCVFSIARKLNLMFPALFHHYNRQKKYKGVRL